jgi:hypothetical protein
MRHVRRHSAWSKYLTNVLAKSPLLMEGYRQSAYNRSRSEADDYHCGQDNTGSYNDGPPSWPNSIANQAR